MNVESHRFNSVPLQCLDRYFLASGHLGPAWLLSQLSTPHMYLSPLETDSSISHSLCEALTAAFGVSWVLAPHAVAG